jgi:hypothetical protein
VSMVETHTAMATWSLDGPRSCTRPCRTLGHDLTMMRTAGEGAHWREAKTVSVIRHGGRRHRSQAAKVGAKGP